MAKFLYMPESMLKKPDPRIASRLPVCPASVSWKEARAAVGLSQRFGPPVPETAAPLGLLVIGGRATPLGVAKLLSCQFGGPAGSVARAKREAGGHPESAADLPAAEDGVQRLAPARAKTAAAAERKIVHHVRIHGMRGVVSRHAP